MSVPTTVVADRDLLDPELSLLAFQHRVLALAADPSVPLLERLRFLGIVTSNIDELYMVRVAELRQMADSTLAQRVEEQVDGLLRAMDRIAAACLDAAASHGVTVCRWSALAHEEQEALREQYREEILPSLQSHAVTLSPGHPVPHLAHLGLFVAVVHRDVESGRLRVVEHELPRDTARLLPVPGRARAVIPLEEVLCANAGETYPHLQVEGAHLFRVTRGGELPVGDSDAQDLLDAVDRATSLRWLNPAVRLEVEGAMPDAVRALLLESLHREAAERERPVTAMRAQVVEGLLDLRCLSALPLPDDAALQYPPLTPHRPMPAGSIFDVIRAGDVLVHHPFESFDDTVVRFFEEAAADPAVTAMAATLYRVGTPSPVAGALLLAAEAGKHVFALVELQARFDEVHNVRWARAIERAGGQVVYGLPGLKVHAKAALVLRREGEQLRRYVHIGTGNYNVRSGRTYTDLSLFSARPALGEDIATLFRALSGQETGVPHAPSRLPHEALVAPEQLRPALLERIAREAAHARAGRPAAITAKCNALADREMVHALYDASEAGVDIHLVVRGICTLRPGVAPYATNIRVTSVVGRFLEHSRVYRFENGGAPEYLIGSSDLRPRNLRRRVELLVPVHDASHRARLDELLAHYTHDATAWTLRADGGYTPPQSMAAGAQAQYLADAVDAAPRR
ncbi:MAG: polyphosphate kinase 1 [Gemmatimonadetes bacterium]|nr:polyphosphate kinase 1 [Gemmatimonadota bacterium]